MDGQSRNDGLVFEFVEGFAPRGFLETRACEFFEKLTSLREIDELASNPRANQRARRKKLQKT